MPEKIKQSKVMLWYFLEVHKYAAKSAFNSVVNLAFSIARAKANTNKDLELVSSTQLSFVQGCLFSLLFLLLMRNTLQ